MHPPQVPTSENDNDNTKSNMSESPLARTSIAIARPPDEIAACDYIIPPHLKWFSIGCDAAYGHYFWAGALLVSISSYLPETYTWSIQPILMNEVFQSTILLPTFAEMTIVTLFFLAFPQPDVTTLIDAMWKDVGESSEGGIKNQELEQQKLEDDLAGQVVQPDIYGQIGNSGNGNSGNHNGNNANNPDPTAEIVKKLNSLPRKKSKSEKIKDF